MKILITESQFKKILNEDFSNREKTIRAAYELMVTASKGIGTDPDDIIKGLKMLKNKEDFYRLNGLFSDGRSGYKSFADMINGEFDYGKILSNNEDLVAVSSELSRMEVGFSKKQSSSFPYWPILKTDINKIMSPIEDYYQPVEGRWTDFPERKISKYCNVVAKNAMYRAKKWWIDHLNSPTTKQNFITTYLSAGNDYPIGEIDNIFSNYKNMVNKMEYRLYDEELVAKYPEQYPEETGGFAPSENTGIVFLNCNGALDDEFMYGTAVHEIQHQLSEYYPLAPEKYVNSINQTKRPRLSSGLDIIKGKYYPHELKEQAIKYGVSHDSMLRFWDMYINHVYSNKDQGYRCRPTEQISRVESIRATEGFKDGEKFTVQRLKPLFAGGNPNFNYLMMCWCERGGDLQSYFDDLSRIAINKPKNTPKNEPKVQNI